MILSDEEVKERLQSPNNLLNKLREATTPRPQIPCLPPTTKDLDLDKDIDEKLAVGKLRETAAGVMATALAELKNQIPNVQKPEKLAQIAGEMNKIVQSRKDDEKKIPGQIIVYAPAVVNENHFQEILLPNDQG